MSRIANQPVVIPKNVKITINNGNEIIVANGSNILKSLLHPKIKINVDDSVATIDYLFEDKTSRALAGTTRANLYNMVIGVTEGFTKKLQTVGVGYRAQVQGKELILSLGFSHPVSRLIPEGLKVECPSNTEINISGADKQKVGQFAAEIRRIRPPEPYKGKGVRYAEETIVIKETKKK